MALHPHAAPPVYFKERHGIFHNVIAILIAMDKTLREKRKRRVRSRIRGTAGRPRVSVFRGGSTVGLQFIDDEAGHTLLSVTHRSKDRHCGVKEAEALGRRAARQAVRQGIKTAVFDRNGYVYHGRVKATAQGMRREGLKL